MAEQQDTERELPASQTRLDEARERGQTPRSRELTTAALLLAGAATLAAVGPHIAQQSLAYLRGALTLTRASAFDPAIALESAGQLAWQGFMPALPVLAVLFFAALLAPLAIGGWLFSSEPLMPDFSRLNPLSGLAKLVSMQSLAELGKAIGKVLLIGGVVGWLIWRDQQAFIMPLAQSPQAAAAFVGHLITRDFVWMAAVLIAIAAVDVPLQLWQHAKGLRMSADELKRAFRNHARKSSLKTSRRPHRRNDLRQPASSCSCFQTGGSIT